MFPRALIPVVAAGAALLSVACGSSSTSSSTAAAAATTTPSPTSSSSTSSQAPTPTPAPLTATPAAVPNTGGTTVGVGTTSLGTFLVDANGKTLYLFEADTTSQSTCNGQCAGAWPPLLTSGAPVAGNGVNAGLLGTTARSDGTMQVTYKGHPLYGFVVDKAAGDTKGEGVLAFGAKWYVVGPSGDKIDKD